MMRFSLRLVAAHGDIERLTATLRFLMAQAQAAQGCEACRLSRDLDDNGALSYVEEWATEADLHEAIRSERFHRLIAVLELGAKEPHVSIEQVVTFEALDYIAGVWGSETS
jgi:quinol monooxygenase YgiN